MKRKAASLRKNMFLLDEYEDAAQEDKLSMIIIQISP